MVHGKNRIPYWIDRSLTGLARPDYDATISFGLPFELGDCPYGKSRLSFVGGWVYGESRNDRKLLRGSLELSRSCAMTTPARLLCQLLSIRESVPFPGTIAASSNEGASSVGGSVVFQIEKGRLRFEFYVAPESGGLSAIEVVSHGEDEFTLEVPSHNFSRRAYINTIPVAPDPFHPLVGQVDLNYLGDDGAALSGATLYLACIPGGHWGAGNTSHWSHIERGGERTNDRMVRLNSQNLSGGGWTINLEEIPEVHRDPGVATHTCTIWRADGKPFVGEELKGLLEDDLRPFLALMFGQPIQFSMVEGHSSSMNCPSTPWGTVFPHWSEEDQSPARNWFTMTTSPCDVPSLFDAFCRLPDGLKRHFDKVIRKYVTSETLGHMSRAEMLEEAASISFAGLDGLTRSIISTYPCRDKWLKKTLMLRPNKRIRDAVEMVLKKELGGLIDQDTLVSALASVRNATAHTDLEADVDDYMELLFRWEQCQFLIEALVLARLGLSEIPNRTSRGKFQIRGKDMFSSVRQYEVRSVKSTEDED